MTAAPLHYEPAVLVPLFDLSDLLGVLDIEVGGADQAELTVQCLPSDHGGVLGSQMLAQQVLIAERLNPGRQVQTLHTVFVNAGTCEQPVTVTVEPLLNGRTLAATSLTLRQGELLICRASLTLTRLEDDYLRQVEAAVPPSTPGEGTPLRRWLVPWETTTLGTNEDRFDGWFRAPTVPGDDTLSRALLAYTSELFPMRQAIWQDKAIRYSPPLPRLVLVQSVTFCEHIDMRAWHRIQIDVPFAGHGRVHGYGRVFDTDGNLGATFQSEGLLRRPRTP